MIRTIPSCFAVALIGLGVPSFAAQAASDSAQGALVVQAQEKPLSVDLKYAYFLIGPDLFEANKTTRRVVFSADDLRATIEACTEVRCATLISNDGLVLELDDAGSASYWAHVQSTQYTSSVDAAGLVLRIDKPDRLAGTLKIDDSGVTARITFDATRVRTFGPAE